MIEIRDCTPEDIPEIKRIHDLKNIDYAFPDLKQPLFLVKKVAVDDGKVIMAVGGYIQAETYLWMDPEWSDPHTRLEVMQQLQDSFLDELNLQGVDCCVCYVPEHIEKSFAKRLDALGWEPNREGWRCWNRTTERITQCV